MVKKRKDIFFWIAMDFAALSVVLIFFALWWSRGNQKELILVALGSAIAGLISMLLARYFQELFRKCPAC